MTKPARIARHTVRTRVLSGFDDPSFGPEPWANLLRRGDTDEVFLTWEWMRAWWDRLGKGQLLLIVAERGHDVYLFATGDSITKANLISVCPAPLGENPDMPARAWELIHIGHALKQADELELDILHNHMNYLPLPFSNFTRTPLVTTLHGAAMLEEDSRKVN